MHDATLARMVDAAASIAVEGGPITVRRVADASGLPVGRVWRRWAKLADCGVDPVACGVNHGLGRRDHDEIEKRIAVVRAAKARLPMLTGLDSETLDEILPD